MSQVKVKVQPGQTIQFPGICAYCALPAADSMQIRKRMGRVTRLIKIPICAACAQKVRRRSGEEERWHKIGLLLLAVFSLIALAIGLLLTPVAWPFGLRLGLALLIAAVVGTAVFILVNIQQNRAASSEKQTIRHAARIATFSWRTTTFDFTNDAFTERFIKINESMLMES